MPDEVREHLTRDQRPFLHPESLQTLQIHSFSSSGHLTHVLQGSGQRTHVLQGSGQKTGKAMIAEAWFCAQWPIFVLFLRFVFGLLYGWKIQTWPITRFLTESVTCWFLSVDIWYNAWCHVSKHDVQDLQQKYRPTTSKIQQYISLYTFLSLCSPNPYWVLAAKNPSAVFAVLIYISLLIILCIIEYVTNKITLNLKKLIF